MLSFVNTLRATATLGAVLFAFGAQPAKAADVETQRVAMACTHGSDAAGCKVAVRHATVERQAEAAPAKAAAQRRQADARQASREFADGSRFTYDSCGCSN